MKPPIYFSIDHENTTYRGHLFAEQDANVPSVFNFTLLTGKTLGKVYYCADGKWRLESDAVPNLDDISIKLDEMIRDHYANIVDRQGAG